MSTSERPHTHHRKKRKRHIEPHFTGSEIMRDIMIGMSDGLTVPFALAAGLSGTATPSTIVVMAGLAEIAAGAISMGLGGYLAARGDAEHYHKERSREVREVKDIPEEERQEIRDVFKHYGLTAEEIEPIVRKLEQNPKDWVDFMMRFELGLDEPEENREFVSAVTIALSYAVAGFIPLSPYFAWKDAHFALTVSICVTLVALFIFGYVKGKIIGVPPGKSAAQMLFVGGLAAAAAFGLAKLVS